MQCAVIVTVSCRWAQVVPPGGGSLLGSGRMWLAPAAETDPRAISFSGEAKDLDADKLLQYYLPPVGMHRRERAVRFALVLFS